MKVLALILLLMLIPLTSASTYTLGSHQVSFNVSEPYNSSAKLDPPTYVADSNTWWYTLNMTNDSEHYLRVSVLELSYADYSRAWPSINFGESAKQYIKDRGIGGYKSSTMDFKGYPAYQYSLPEQKIVNDIGFIRILENLGTVYQIDERTVVQVFAVGVTVQYQEILDTIEVIDAPTKPTKYAPYISSNAGNSTSE